MANAIEQAGSKLEASAAERIDSGAEVYIPFMSPKQLFMQGDVGVLCIAELPEDAHEIPKPPGGQVVPGTSKGSRHCVEGAVCFYESSRPSMLSEYCVSTSDRWKLRHPEHGDLDLPPGKFRFIHQQNEAGQRIRD